MHGARNGHPNITHVTCVTTDSKIEPELYDGLPVMTMAPAIDLQNAEFCFCYGVHIRNLVLLKPIRKKSEINVLTLLNLYLSIIKHNHQLFTIFIMNPKPSKLTNGENILTHKNKNYPTHMYTNFIMKRP